MALPEKKVGVPPQLSFGGFFGPRQLAIKAGLYICKRLAQKKRSRNKLCREFLVDDAQQSALDQAVAAIVLRARKAKENV